MCGIGRARRQACAADPSSVPARQVTPPGVTSDAYVVPPTKTSAGCPASSGVMTTTSCGAPIEPTSAPTRNCTAASAQSVDERTTKATQSVVAQPASRSASVSASAPCVAAMRSACGSSSDAQDTSPMLDESSSWFSTRTSGTPSVIDTVRSSTRLGRASSRDAKNPTVTTAVQVRSLSISYASQPASPGVRSQVPSHSSSPASHHASMLPSSDVHSGCAASSSSPSTDHGDPGSTPVSARAAPSSTAGTSGRSETEAPVARTSPATPAVTATSARCGRVPDRDGGPATKGRAPGTAQPRASHPADASAGSAPGKTAAARAGSSVARRTDASARTACRASASRSAYRDAPITQSAVPATTGASARTAGPPTAQRTTTATNDASAIAAPTTGTTRAARGTRRCSARVGAQNRQRDGAGGMSSIGRQPASGSAPWNRSTHSGDGVGQPGGVRKSRGGVASCTGRE
ncbi:hypothetical protein Cus16_2022 [Curtobacterium sp. ER1/6]|nr:hypothetical protein Cus16_2022 [Curtobacterium sp. ER1/6]